MRSHGHKDPTTAPFNRAVRQYKRNARVRNTSWALTNEECRVLFDAACFYCGRIGVNATKGEYSAYRHNGIDRIDTATGYTRSNVVACCGTCNRAKSDMSVDAFIDWLACVTSHRFHEQNIETWRQRIFGSIEPSEHLVYAHP
jgi:hypothetical protein